MIRLLTIPVSLILLMLSFNAQAQNAIEDVLLGCEKDVEKYCSMVTPGDGRILSCMEAHEDKISKECRYSINRASYLISKLALTVGYLANQCIADAQKLCSDIEPGDGRIVSCLAKNQSSLDSGCSKALKDVQD
jgi:Cysteine rich repeat